MFRLCLMFVFLVSGTVKATADSDASWLNKILASSDAPTRGAAKGARAAVPAASTGGGETGVASCYWQSQRVASGGWFNPDAMTAAHKSLPFGSRVRVTHLTTGRSVTVLINDGSPFVRGRIIDLSRAEARSLGMTDAGIATVRIERI